jgi:hypothetical protein
VPFISFINSFDILIESTGILIDNDLLFQPDSNPNITKKAAKMIITSYSRDQPQLKHSPATQQRANKPSTSTDSQRKSSALVEAIA